MNTHDDNRSREEKLAPVKLTDPAQLETLRDRMAQYGWTFKARFIDHDITKPLIGVRLTNAAKIMEEARSIQIFDRATVTLQTGFTNDEAISLTDDDGRDFLQWMRAAYPELMAPIWDSLAEPDSADAKVQAGAYVDLGKNHLVIYLAEAYPEIFGRYGIISITGANFYTELLRVVKDPDRDDAKRLAVIQELENLAHDFYSDAAAALRIAAAGEAAAGGEKLVTVDHMRRQAHGHVIAAERARERANHLRQRMETPPPVRAYPEAITMNTEGAVITEQPLAAAAPAAEPLVGDVVGILDPTSPYFRQMGRVKRLHPTGADVEISGQAEPIRFENSQLMVMA